MSAVIEPYMQQKNHLSRSPIYKRNHLANFTLKVGKSKYNNFLWSLCKYQIMSRALFCLTLYLQECTLVNILFATFPNTFHYSLIISLKMLNVYMLYIGKYMLFTSTLIHLVSINVSQIHYFHWVIHYGTSVC